MRNNPRHTCGLVESSSNDPYLHYEVVYAYTGADPSTEKDLT